MRKALFFLLFISVSANCLAQKADTTKYLRTSDGSEYIIFPSAAGAQLVNGNFMEISVLATYNDSILFSTTEEGMPQYAMYDTSNFPPAFKQMLGNIKLGDSVLMRISTDSLIAKGQAAPFMNKGEYIYQSYTFRNIFATQAQADSAQKVYFPAAKEKAQKKQLAIIEKSLVDNKVQIDADSKLIEAYLVKNKMAFTKGRWGTYVVTKKAGTGKKITVDDVVAVNYTGKNFSNNKVFDSNTDPKFKHVEPYDVPMGSLSGLILGWFDGLFEMQKGTAATIYIPSTLGYGIAGREPEIAPNAILVFDMAVVKVRTENEMAAEEEAKATKQPLPAAPKKTIKKPVAATKKPVAKPKPKTKTAGK